MARIYMYSVACLLIYLVRPGSSLFSWHPTLMTIGAMFIFYEAIILFDLKKGLLEGTTRQTKINIHGLLQFIGTVILFTGFTSVAMHKFNLNKPHFASLHSALGAAAGATVGWQCLGGIVTRFSWLSPVPVKYLKLGHTIFGTLSYFFICLTFIVGIFTDYMAERTTPFIQIILITLPMIAFATGFTRFINKVLQNFLKPK
uniref:ascorbate ferrireductase (transmembrane) n=1 Tax=Strigamia maritima TaxID=126957 RepID=T1IQ30_STRMM